MLDKFDYFRVPNGFAHCFNDRCEQAGSCLRHQIIPYIPEERWSVPIVNPARIVPGGDCPGFMSDQPVRFAYGMEHLLDELPYREAKEVKSVMKRHFGKTCFYRLKRRERCFSPQDQQYVRNLFRRHGIEKEPAFDSYTEDFLWDAV